MTTRHALAVLLFGSLLPATLPAAPTAVELQGVTIGSKFKTTPVNFKTRVGLAGGGSLAPGLYDVEVASTGDKSRVMLLFFQNGRKMGETPGALKLGTSPGGAIGPCAKPGGAVAPCAKPGGAVNPCAKPGSAVNPCGRPASGVNPCGKPGGIVNPCAKPSGEAGQASGKRYFSFEQLGFAGGVKPSLRTGVGGGTLLTIPGAGGASIEAELPAAH